jgi:hypothetical protein
MSAAEASHTLGEAQRHAMDMLRGVLPRDAMALVVVGNRVWMQQNLLHPVPPPARGWPSGGSCAARAGPGRW